MADPTKKPFRLKAEEIVVRQPDCARWDLARLASFRGEDTDLASVGLDDWAAALDREDRR